MIDYYRILQKYELKKAKFAGNEMRCCCLLHDEDNPSFSVNLETGKYMCFAGCGGGDFIDLISKLERVSREEVEKVIANFDDKDIILNELKKKLEKLFEQEETESKNVILDESVLNRFDYTNYDYMIKRGFNFDTLKEFGIGYYKGNVTIPIRDENNNLVAVLRRPIVGKLFKYMPIIPKYGYKKSKVLFGLNKIGKEDKEVMIVEGHFDVIKAFQEGFRNTVALQGSNMSVEQMNLILYRFDRTILALDNDDVGKKTTKMVIRNLRNKICIYNFKYQSDEIKDIGDMNKEQIQYGVNNRELILC